MSVRRSAGAIFWGLTLVTIGGLLLAHNLGYPVQIWPYVARYWPALLIGWGLLKFVDYYRFRSAGDTRPLFSGGEVALLILVIFAGSAITTAANVSPGLGTIFEIGDLDLWDITGNSYTFDEHEELQRSAQAGSDIDVVNFFGNVEVRPSTGDRIIIDVKKTIRASSKDEAERLNRDFNFSIQELGSNYRIASNRDDLGFHGGPRQRYKSSMLVQVPQRSSIHLDNRNGRVTLEGLTGNQSIANRYGEVEVRNIAGELRVENRNGGVTAQDITQLVVINNRYSNTTAKNIGGNLEISTRNGSVDVTDVKGDATITNSYAPINVENVQGQLTINGRNNSIDAQHIEGDIRAESSYQNVNIRDPRGGVSLNSRNGDITVSFIKAPQKDVTISSRYGNITVELPSSSAFNIDAHTQYGEVDSEFDGLRHDRSNRERSLSGRVGQGGPNISVGLRNGDIRIARRG